MIKNKMKLNKINLKIIIRIIETKNCKTLEYEKDYRKEYERLREAKREAELNNRYSKALQTCGKLKLLWNKQIDHRNGKLKAIMI